jgi:imidazolonepropionase-like amidohydrolase/Tol biopolymer transport system component
MHMTNHLTRTAAALALAALTFVPAAARQAPADSKDQAKDKEKDKKAWDITQPLGPPRAIAFETSEGTWVNVDVSPDGKRVVFDLLGDLYVMPIEGTGSGLAERLTSGAAFDMQPRFSPDGKWIAFASDRDGLTNIWVMKPDGSQPHQVSTEKKWYVNSPTWAPDSQYLYARRHFVKERSGGAGEVWLYHVSGGEGVQVTEKNGWQKDAGEPAASPDGKYLYYSKDVTPGQVFEYNKDPYGTIYAILRRDLATGKERTAVSSAGGSIAPRVSPDGKTLSFIRRVGSKTTLFVRTIETGEERPVFDRLDRDMQETWAIQGVYPQYGWTPDSRNLVIWGEGKIWNVDVAAGRGVEVPFRARVEQTAYARIVFPQEVHPKQFTVKMLRDVAVAPNGSAVAFNALGHVYVRPLPSGEPKRLTSDASFEFHPAWSPDGTRLVYATWSDADAGRIRVVAASGGAAKEIVTRPGHYTEPTFSPDGRLVAYRKVSGDRIRGETFGEDTGLYVVNSDGSGAPRLVREQGTDPKFDVTGTRLFFLERRGDKLVLASVNLNGGEEQVHVQSENASQIVPSPDGRWVAFSERYHAFVAAMPRSGRAVDIGPSVTAYPSARISRDAGIYLHWSGDSSKVYWTLGPELFTRELVRTFKFLNDALDKPAEPESKGVFISMTAKSDEPDGVVALEHARLITMDPKAGRDGVIENGTVVVRGNRIEAVGPAGSVRVPANATRVDARARTIIPGLIDVHAHVGGEDDGILAEQSWPLVANLAYGVTTAHDPSNDTETVFANSELVRAGMKLSPRLFSTGTILYGAETPFKAVVENYDDALAHLRRLKAVGAFSVKSYNQQRRDTRQMILKAARELQMMVVPEGASLQYYDEQLVQDGHTGLEHALPVPHVYKDVVQLFAQAGAAYTPTLIVGYGGLFGENYWYEHDEVWKNERLLTYTPREVIDSRARRRTVAAEDDFNHISVARGVKQMLDAGVSIQLGAHGQLQGLGAHWELWMFVQGGMTPLEALRCGTIGGAKYLGLDRDLGSLEVGKLADLLVLDKNPLENIRNSDSVRDVMLNGRLYDAATMNEVGAHPKMRPAFPWRRPVPARTPTATSSSY